MLGFCPAVECRSHVCLAKLFALGHQLVNKIKYLGTHFFRSHQSWENSLYNNILREDTIVNSILNCILTEDIIPLTNNIGGTGRSKEEED